MKKLGLSIKFLQNLMHVRKNALGLGLIKLSTITAMMKVKTHMRNKRFNRKSIQSIQLYEESKMIKTGINKTSISSK